MKTKFSKEQKARLERAVRLGDVRRILTDLGLKFDEKKHGDLWFKCVSPTHKDKDPSAHICADRTHHKHGVCNCFGCKDSGTTIMLVRDWLGLSFWESVHWVEARIYADENVQPVRQIKRVEPELPPEFEFYEDESEWNPPYLEYLYGRGITWNQIVRHRIGYCDKGRNARRVIIPVFLHGRLRTWIGRHIWEGKRITSCDDGLVGLFASEHANPKNGPDIIVEGWADQLAVERIEFTNCMALQTNAILPEQFEYIKRFPYTILLGDGDDGGKRLVDSAAPYAEQHEFRVAKIPWGDDPASLVLKPHGEAVLSAAIQDSESWNPTVDERIVEFEF